jgi:hypothetical protein
VPFVTLKEGTCDYSRAGENTGMPADKLMTNLQTITGALD